jgi:hypothetical protein
MKLRFLLVLFLFTVSLVSKGQGYYDQAMTYEAGISIGPMNSLTDIGGRRAFGSRGPKDLNLKSTTLFGSLYGVASFKHFLALRVEASIGSVKSNDSLLAPVKPPNPAIGRYTRNLSFRSPIEEVSLTLEFHPITFFSGDDPQQYPPTFSPYLIGGVGYFHFNPQANLEGKWIDLRPLHTEGQGFAEYPDRKNYTLSKVNVPYGIGVFYEVSPKFNIRLEYISRMIFTDYLDDVHDTYIDPALFQKYLTGSDLNNALILNNRRRPNVPESETTARPGGRRGNPLNNDSYFTINLKIGYAFGRNKASSGFGNGGGYWGIGRGNRISDRKLSKARKNQRTCPKMF